MSEHVSGVSMGLGEPLDPAKRVASQLGETVQAGSALESRGNHLTVAGVHVAFPQAVHTGGGFVDEFGIDRANFVDKAVVPPQRPPVWFDLPEGAVGTVRRGGE
jgi:hypothetical protein